MEHRYSDGERDLVGFLARPESGGPKPGVLVVHEAPGLGEHPKHRAAMLAELGYVALAADLYGGGEVFQGPASFTAMSALREDPELLRRRVRAGLDVLAGLDGVDPGRLAAIGYCFGGMAVLELARSGADLRAVISFHGLLETSRPAERGAIKAAILACTGSEDPLVPPEQIAAFEREMTDADADWQIVTFGGARHAFTNRNAALAGNPALEWKPAADRRSWMFMTHFLADSMGVEA
jgi:dienelactone hydrolase